MAKSIEILTNIQQKLLWQPQKTKNPDNSNNKLKQGNQHCEENITCKDTGNEKRRQRKKKMRRSKNVRNKLEHFKLIYANSRGVKSKVQSLSDIVSEKILVWICIVEIHREESDKIDIEGYNKIFRNDKTEDSGGIMKACINEIGNIVV